MFRFFLQSDMVFGIIIPFRSYSIPSQMRKNDLTATHFPVNILLR